MRLSCNAPASLWDEFCLTAVYLSNFTITSANHDKTPFQLWYNRVPSLSHLQEIGCHAFALINTNNTKIFRCSTPCTLIGYALHSKAYCLWDNTSNSVFNSFHVTFIEHLDTQSHALLPGTTVALDPDTPPSWDVPCPDPSPHPPLPHISPTIPSIVPPVISPVAILPSITAAPIPRIEASVTAAPVPQIAASIPPIMDASPAAPSMSPVPPVPVPAPDPPSMSPDPPVSSPPAPASAVPQAPAPLRRSERIAARSHALTVASLDEFSPLASSHSLVPLSLDPTSPSIDHVLSALADGSLEPSLDDDPTWAEALASPEREFWVAGAREEIQSLQDLQVFVLVPRSSVPSNRQPMHGKLVCKRKRDDSGNVTRFKVRYVAKGYAQRYGIDYDKTTAPTACLESFRLLLHFAASMGWELHQFDIKTAFLNGILPDEEVAYMEQPPGFEEPGKDDRSGS